MKIVIFGLGYVGFTAACCLTREGHEVIGVDVNADKISEINAGQPPIKEPKVAELLTEALRKNLIRAVVEMPDLLHVDLAIVCVGTPSSIDGSHNMSFVAEVTRQIAETVSPDRARPLTVAYRSTFRPGTVTQLVEPIFQSYLGDRTAQAIEAVYNPEFLREASAVDDFFNPPKIVVGTRDGARSAVMDALHEGLDAPVFYTEYEEAEITKFVDNTWHATKVAFANEVGRICHRMGVSAKTMHEIFVSDTKLNISSYYTRPGGAFGGSCLPKDVRALQHIAGEVGAHTHLIDSLLRTNEAHKSYQAQHIMDRLPAGGRVLMAGLAFKAETDDLRESPNVDIARRLLQAGYQLSVYDPAIRPADLRGQNLGYAFTHLPNVSNLLVDRATAEAGPWDLVIGSNRIVNDLNLGDAEVVRTYEYD
ncbi:MULTISPECIES: nucleotide sugar dehydrogenase [unclassified Ruegeria]|uniref:nucleotide sugar dehydrogenase n=1 Tax=unclassified Ruegeria TaxID=2625375 RepID=UPI0014929D63|nr:MULTISPECIES: nucleotide sugar dehydrogenase [unclassified Ruegeria]NOD36578.1 nucleotide sugar dehydrogenase [Ruegeria sp. HKCCD7296]NOE43818.1 nucleotide sugar dehydrogenase [Ruegeria sp. HKCCD7319]